jgi:uncharacterized RDD family membrane protein YckC
MHDNPYGLPPAPPPPPPPNPQYGGPFGSPFGPPQSSPPPPPSNPFEWQQNPYAPPSVHAQGPAWAQAFDQAQPLATPGARLGAHLLDGCLYFGAMMVLALPGAALGDEAAGAFGFLGMLALAVYQWYLLSTTGQSLGKKWIGVRVVKLDGSPVDFVSAVLLRSWAFYALSFVGGLLVVGAILPLVDALMIFGDQRRCLHDHLAGTKVVVA